MKKITRYEDIPRFTQRGANQSSVRVQRIFAFLEEFASGAPIDLNPDFQRGHVWTEAQQVAWLEFFMRDGETGHTLYFNNRNEKVIEIVDGKQRLEAIRRFLDNEIMVFGSYRREFTDNPNHLMRSLIVNVNNLKTRAEVLQWYIDFNSGGVVHATEEIDRVKALLERERSGS